MNSLPHSRVNLGDIVRLSLPLGTATYPGDNLSQRPVNWAVVLTDASDEPEQMRPGDLVIVPQSLQGQLNPAALTDLIDRLGQRDVAAVAFFAPVAEATREAAAERDTPLLILPEGAALRDIHQTISALLVDQQTQLSERGMQLYRRLSEMSREGHGLIAMTELMSKLTGKIIVVQDKRLEIRALSRPIDSQLDARALRDFLEDKDSLPSVLRNRKQAARTRQTHWHQVLPLDNAARLICPIISGDRARGYLSVIGPAGELDLLDTLTVEQGAAACALEMAKAKAISEAKKALRGNFLEGLLAGTLPRAEIERLAGRLDHNTEPPHAVLVFAWDGDKTPSMRRLETTINWLVSSHSRQALVHVYGGDHIIVFQALREEESDLSPAQELARRIYEQVRSEHPNQRLVAGLSGPAGSLAEWPDTYRQALTAMQLSERLRRGQLVEYNSTGIYQLLAALDDNATLHDFARRILGPLAAYDDRHRSNLVQTIDAYFNHHGNISQTSESLFIHRNTLLYRLERIQELTQQFLDQADMRLALHLALKLWQLRPQAKEGGPPAGRGGAAGKESPGDRGEGKAGSPARRARGRSSV